MNARIHYYCLDVIAAVRECTVGENHAVRSWCFTDWLVNSTEATTTVFASCPASTMSEVAAVRSVVVWPSQTGSRIGRSDQRWSSRSNPSRFPWSLAGPASKTALQNGSTGIVARPCGIDGTRKSQGSKPMARLTLVRIKRLLSAAVLSVATATVAQVHSQAVCSVKASLRDSNHPQFIPADLP